MSKQVLWDSWERLCTLRHLCRTERWRLASWLYDSDPRAHLGCHFHHISPIEKFGSDGEYGLKDLLREKDLNSPTCTSLLFILGLFFWFVRKCCSSRRIHSISSVSRWWLDGLYLASFHMPGWYMLTIMPFKNIVLHQDSLCFPPSRASPEVTFVVIRHWCCM